MTLKVVCRAYVPGDDDQLRWIDHSTANAILTCPRWGLVRYWKGLRVPRDAAARDLSTELGQAVHQCTAVNRLYSVLHFNAEYADVDGTLDRLFGRARGRQLRELLDHDTPDAAVLECIATSGYYDDPYDKRRTLSNAETAMLYYVREHDLQTYKVMIKDEQPLVEIPLQFVVTFNDEWSYRYVGRIDGIHQYGNEVVIQDDKTASRLTEHWATQWYTSHQITGYMIGVSFLLERPVTQALIAGLQIPLPVKAFTGYSPCPVERTEVQFDTWGRWLFQAVSYIHQYEDNVWAAPTFTHSCFRYFRPCPFIGLCTATEEELEEDKGQLVVDKWDPTKDERQTE